MPQNSLPIVNASGRDGTITSYDYEPKKFLFFVKWQQSAAKTSRPAWCLKYYRPASSLDAMGTNSILEDKRLKLDATFRLPKRVVLWTVSGLILPKAPPST